MRSGFLGLTLVLPVFAFSAVMLAQTAKPSGAVTNIPNLSGTWNRGIGHSAAGIFEDDPGGVPFLGFTKQDPPLQSSAMEIYQANRKGITDPRLKGRDDSDPSNSCFPPGPTRIFTVARPFEIRQTRGRSLYPVRGGSLGAPNLYGWARTPRRLSEHVDGALDRQV